MTEPNNVAFIIEGTVAEEAGISVVIVFEQIDRIRCDQIPAARRLADMTQAELALLAEQRARLHPWDTDPQEPPPDDEDNEFRTC